jgi:hypothetical protein
LQSFRVSGAAHVRFLKLVWVSHSGSEFYCTLSQFKVYGATSLESLQRSLSRNEGRTGKVRDRIAEAKRNTEVDEGSPGREDLARGGSHGYNTKCVWSDVDAIISMIHDNEQNEWTELTTPLPSESVQVDNPSSAVPVEPSAAGLDRRAAHEMDSVPRKRAAPLGKESVLHIVSDKSVCGNLCVSKSCSRAPAVRELEIDLSVLQTYLESVVAKELDDVTKLVESHDTQVRYVCEVAIRIIVYVSDT